MTEPRGSIYLVARAPLNSSYEHTIDFENSTYQFQYWLKHVKFTLTNYSYVRRERRFLQVEKSFDELDDVNYLFFNSSTTSKTIYAFVTDREYVNDGMTRIYFEIDVMQTYLFDFKFQPSFITQAHVDRWDANHKPIYSKTDEGLNYGSEYITEAAFRVVPSSPEMIGEAKHGFYLLFCSEHNSFVGSGAASEVTLIYGNPTPYCIYLLPTSEDPIGAITTIKFKTENGYSSIANGYGLETFQKFMANSAFGKALHHIVYVPYLPFEYIMEDSTTIAFTGKGNPLPTFAATTLTSGSYSVTLLKITSMTPAPKGEPYVTLASMPRETGLDLMLPSEEMFDAVRANPYSTEYDRRFQSKLLCYPYRYNILSDWNSAPALIKNEYLTGDDFVLKMSIGFGFNVPRRFWLSNYRGDPEGRESGIMQAIPFDQPIVSDAYYEYMLQNKNQIAANQANAAINAAYGAVTGAVSGAMSGAAAGGGWGALGGALMGGVSAGISGALNVQALIRSENAKQADIRNLPDSISIGNDCSYVIQDQSKYITLYRKKIACEFEEQLAQYWHMYGYKVNRLMIPNLKSRVRFNFVKTIGANITGAIENNYLQQIKQIFDTGVTFWHCKMTYSGYGNYDVDPGFKPLDYTYENMEVSLI